MSRAKKGRRHFVGVPAKRTKSIDGWNWFGGPTASRPRTPVDSGEPPFEGRDLIEIRAWRRAGRPDVEDATELAEIIERLNDRRRELAARRDGLQRLRSSGTSLNV